MFGLGSQARVRILLIEARGVSLLRWQRGSLRLFKRFGTGQGDLDAFEALLHSEHRVPFIVVLDGIEEDFRMESLAHVTGADRINMIERKLSIMYRNSPYRTARVVGREKDGRRDDRFLFTALNKADLVDPWVCRILQQKLSILCITSAAYLMESMSGTLKLRHLPHVLLVNIESGSGMRQTYLQKGRVIFSRLTPLALEQGRDLNAMLLQQADQTRKYLERIKQLPYETTLPVHVLLPPAFAVDVPSELPEKLMRFETVQTEALFPSGSLDTQTLEPGALALSLVQSLRRSGVRNVYAPAGMRRYYTLGRIAGAMYASAAVVALGSVIFMAPSLSDALSTREREASTLAQTRPLLAQYEELRGSFPETPINSTTMALVVRTHDLLQSQSHNPAELLGVVGEAMENAPTMRLSALNFELRTLPLSAEEQPLLTGLESPNDLFRLAVMSGRTELVVRLEGTVQSANSFRAARDEVLAFIATLEQRPGITVNSLVMPIDIRADTAVQTLVDDSEVTESFALEVVQQLRTALDDVEELQP
jgi:hypothetical protein